MLFNSYSYPAFLLASVLFFWLLPARFRSWWLIAVGVAFYASHSALALGVVVLLAAGVYAALRSAQTGAHARWLLAYAVCVVLAVLTYYKYGMLLWGSAHSLLGAEASALHIVMPLGISFFTFEFVHVLVDARRGVLGTLRVRDFLAFIFFFPSLLAGPIKRYQDFAHDLEHVTWRATYVYAGVCWILWGYVQKYVLADPLIPFTRTLAHPEALLTQLHAVLGITLYALRIYFDFAGLSAIAIGSALLFGIRLPINFSRPYFSPNIQEFWRRWHMSLGSWVRDYLYIPLGGNRVPLWRQQLNLLLAMTVVGVWHGAGWNFAVWGLYHGCLLAAHALWRRAGFSFGTHVWGRALGMATTFVLVVIGWVFFVTTSLPDAMLLLGKMFGLSA